MKKRWASIACLALIVPAFLSACSTDSSPQAEAPTETGIEGEVAEDTADESGILQIRANGEDFVRQGFVSKDGWTISFDHLYVNLVDPTVYQTDPPFDPDGTEDLQAETVVGLNQAITVDLAEGDENAEPIVVGEMSAPAGQYNAISWKMMPASDGPAAGSTLMLIGTAQKDGEAIDFNIQLDPEYAYTCGEFVGDARKGIVSAGETADVEATFHFDHIFGDGDASADDPINTGALGFDPLAALAADGQLEVDMATLEEQLSPDAYSTLEETVAGLGHVGEGHCSEVGGHTHS